ncbi:MAG: DUF503 domain-containing protein [Thermomicrobium sp.]|nr:DUF503 domain-containing protein [Thermomicrobium sp.]MDW8005680.1 DUF503 domain-containing protein [Thermomicrobium sp.]GBD19340.1 hypothetical protein HRbin27_01846 [bacterium HR27]
MVIGVTRIAIEIPSAHSLKEKRKVVRSVIDQVKHRFNVAIAEVDGHAQWQFAELGVACVSTSPQHADEMLRRVLQFIEEHLAEGYLLDYQTEVIHL